MTSTGDLTPQPYELLERALYLQRCLSFGKLTAEQRREAQREITELEAAMRVSAGETDENSNP